MKNEEETIEILNKSKESFINCNKSGSYKEVLILEVKLKSQEDKIFGFPIRTYFPWHFMRLDFDRLRQLDKFKLMELSNIEFIELLKNDKISIFEDSKFTKLIPIYSSEVEDVNIVSFDQKS